LHYGRKVAGLLFGISFNIDITLEALLLQLRKYFRKFYNTASHTNVPQCRIIICGNVFQMYCNDVATQFLYRLQWINAAFWPVPEVGTHTKIGMSLQCHQRRVGIPVMANPSPVLVNSHLDAIGACKTIDTVPHVQWWFGGYEFHSQLFRDIKLFLPGRDRGIPDNVNRCADKTLSCYPCFYLINAGRR